MNSTIILLTAALKWDNLINIAKSINKYKDTLKDSKLIWLVCHDKYNGYGDKYEIIKYCNAHNISIVCYDSGKPNQKNYGGDMYNEPLQDLSNRLSLDPKNTWIYVLDDDNLVHPNLFSTFNIASQDPHIKVIWMNYILADGTIPNVTRGNAMTCNRDNTLYNNFPDPSCIFIRLDKLQEVGYYRGGSDYDVYLGRSAVEANFSEVAFPEDYGMKYPLRVSAYHNGQQGLLDIDNDFKGINNGQFENAELRTQNKGDKARVYPIPEELVPKILYMVGEYYRTQV